MKIKKQTVLKIKIKGDDIKNLQSAINKTVLENQKIGFGNNSLTKEEKNILNQILESIE